MTADRARASDPLASQLASSLRRRGLSGARLAIVLGSGLGVLVERIDRARRVPFDALDEMPRSRVPGHAGSFVIGDLSDTRVLVQSGRVHLYEDASAEAVCRSIRAFAEIGVDAVLLTNAAGALREDWAVPSLMRIVDHVNFQGVTPLHPNERRRSSPYDDRLGQALERGAQRAHVALRTGVYAGVLGPAYESAEEARMLAWAGADAVGMSTVCEAQAASAAGLRVAAVSVLANHTAGAGGGSTAHSDVLAASARIGESFARLVEACAPLLAEPPE